MLRRISLAAAAACLVMAGPALAASPVVGNWAAKITVQEMVIESTIMVSEAGGGYAVDIKDGPMPGAPPEAAAMPSKISDVAVDGSKLTFKRHLTTPQGEMDLAYALNAEGNNLTGTINSQFGDIPISGIRE